MPTEPVGLLGRALAEGFVYQGEPRRYRGEAARRAERRICRRRPSSISCRTTTRSAIARFGERLTQLAPPRRCGDDGDPAARAADPACCSWARNGAARALPLFRDFKGELADAVRKGRRREFERFPGFHPEEQRPIPDPCGRVSLEQSAIDWSAQSGARHAAWLRHCRELIAIRAQEIMPRLGKPLAAPPVFETAGICSTVRWGLRRWRLLDFGGAARRRGARRLDRGRGPADLDERRGHPE